MKMDKQYIMKLDCTDFKKGRCVGDCDGMGHYKCDVCKFRKPKKERKNG